MEIIFDFEKATPGTYRFKERKPADGSRPAVGTLYVIKAAFIGPQPKTLTVTIVADDAAA